MAKTPAPHPGLAALVETPAPKRATPPPAVPAPDVSPDPLPAASELPVPVSDGLSFEVPDATPFVVGTSRVVKFTALPMTFAGLIETGIAAQKAAQRAKADKPSKFFTRERIKAQLRATDASGNTVALDDAAILQMPIRLMNRVRKFLDEAPTGDAGKIINDGDGISAPILYRLGKPLRLRDANGELTIPELEIHARTYGDIEDVQAIDGPWNQANALLATCATPVGCPVQMMVLPSWALEQISAEDGIFIASEIVPRFFE